MSKISRLLASCCARALLVPGLVLAAILPAQAQQPAPPTSLPTAPPPDSAASAAPRSHRLPVLAGGLVVSYTGLLYLLDQGWYTGPRSSFHWFNDLPEWRQMDKAGHFWGAFHESRGAVDMLRWARVPDRTATWYGGFVGFLLQSPIEVLDGRDPAYGASATDLAANFLGSAALIGQQLAWNEVRIMPKYSFHTTSYARLRPNVLGKSLAEQHLKDYNGQTYWLCTDLAAWLRPESKWPKWLQPAVGYGAQEMVYNDPDANAALGLYPYRQYYLSLDVNLRRIPTRSKLLKRVFYVASIFHLPAPALEYNSRHGLVLHGLYF
ncbi:YfiM family protein [Hymenobacter cellulosilyticus]|uniref:YfiM family protein n=1 Tax=Hymenobacter cellulosilyticus TaxID=2932248 RepID=A0A8T9PYW7_9BACT|nr:YfiM family protein [Hymenobacter cellulosilyticus]UOQ70287.1 YfiM family protein [Hymenobacter cellulosilyticus]